MCNCCVCCNCKCEEKPRRVINALDTFDSLNNDIEEFEELCEENDAIEKQIRNKIAKFNDILKRYIGYIIINYGEIISINRPCGSNKGITMITRNGEKYYHLEYYRDTLYIRHPGTNEKRLY